MNNAKTRNPSWLTYHHNDVLGGRGNKQHEGNAKFRTLVREKTEIYRSAKRSEKNRIAESIVLAIGQKDPPGRFLEQDSKSSLWYDVGQERAIERTKQAFRDFHKEIARSSCEYKRFDRPEIMPSSDIVCLTGATHTAAAKRVAVAKITMDSLDGESKPLHDTENDQFPQLESIGESYTPVLSNSDIDCTNPIETHRAAAKRVAVPNLTMDSVEGESKRLHDTENDKFPHLKSTSESYSTFASNSDIDCTKQREHSDEMLQKLFDDTTARRLAVPNLTMDSMDGESKPLHDTENDQFPQLESIFESNAPVPSHSDIYFSNEHEDCDEMLRKVFNDVIHDENLKFESLHPEVRLLSSSCGNEEGNVLSGDSPSLVKKNKSSRIYYMKDEENRAGGRTGAVAVKVLSGDVNPGDISRLYDEYVLSRHLRGCSCIRAALRYGSVNSNHALYLEWVAGVTLSEWRKSISNKPDSVNIALHAAEEISKSISEMHEAGVLHNNIDSENILIIGGDDEISIKVIDLGSATLFQHMDEGNSLDTKSFFNGKQKDLVSLGAVLYELFLGVEYTFHKEHGHFRQATNSESRFNELKVTSEKRHHVQCCESQTVGQEKLEDLPMAKTIPHSVLSLVSNLLETGPADERYVSVMDLQDDLHMMRSYPDRFLIAPCKRKKQETLDFQRDMLFGRESETSELMNVYHRVIVSRGSSEVVLVSGNAGAGKSALVQQLRQQRDDQDLFFIGGKYDQLQQGEPVSAIVDAFTEYCELVVRRGEECVQRTKNTILNHVGPDVRFLINLIPSLQKIVGCPPHSDLSDIGFHARSRLSVNFQRLIQAIAGASHRVVLFLDDLQWADKESLQLVHAVCTGIDIKSFLLIGAHRNGEVNAAHPRHLHLEEIARKDVCTHIVVENMRKEDVNDMISYTLLLPRRVVQPLTDIVYEMTGGNAIFLIQILKTLVDEGLLTYSTEYARWEWDTKGVKSWSIAEKAVETIICKKIRILPSDVVTALQLAACLGSCCDEKILTMVTGYCLEGNVHESEKGDKFANENILCRLLDGAVTQGLLEKQGHKYHFVHDHIQQAAYSLIPEHERANMHLQIGDTIRTAVIASTLEEVIFVVVDQMNKGKEQICDQDTAIELSKLNLKAGRKAMRSSAFSTAARYLQVGISLLGEFPWEEHYGLCLNLYNSCVESEYCTGELESMGKMMEKIFANARTFKDKLHAYKQLLVSLGAQRKVEEALEVGFGVLEQLGEPFPESVVRGMAGPKDSLEKMALEETLKTIQDLNDFAEDDLLMMVDMENEEKNAAMQFLYQMGFFATILTPHRSAFINLRMLQLSLSHGMSKESGYAFAACGVVFFRNCGDMDKAHWFGQIALALLKRFKYNDSRVQLAVYGSIALWNQDMRLSLDPLHTTSRAAFSSGDIMVAMVNASLHIRLCFQCGSRLSIVLEKTRAACEEMKHYKQNTVLFVYLPFFQTVLNLTGRSQHTWLLSGEAMHHDDYLRRGQIQKNEKVLFSLFFHSLYLAYIFGEYERASAMADECREIACFMFHSVLIEYIFYDGLLSFALARETKLKKWSILADKAFSKMKEWTIRAPGNFRNKFVLLDAERAFLAEEYAVAAMLYDDAISLADENGFIQEKALAYERAAIFHLSKGNDSDASHYYDNAYNSYLEWGSRAKADHVRCRALSLVMVSAV